MHYWKSRGKFRRHSLIKFKISCGLKQRTKATITCLDTHLIFIIIYSTFLQVIETFYRLALIEDR